MKIALIGNNGCGKTTLLKSIQGAYVPQIIDGYDSLSGGQRFNKVLSEVLSQNPPVLCLDEPTNHLDRKNRRSLLRMLQNYRGDLYVASHDVELLRTCVDVIWHLEAGKVHVFNGRYDDYMRELHQKRANLEAELGRLKIEKRLVHESLMKEQERASKRKAHGEKKYADDKLALRSAQGRGQLTMNKNKKRIGDERSTILTQLQELRVPEVIKPTFSMTSAELKSSKPILMIQDGSCGYPDSVVSNVHVQLGFGERIALVGDNGSGKTTIVKAILQDAGVTRRGTWIHPSRNEIGYLDQHYANLNPELSAFQIIQEAASAKSIAEIRKHLNDFLFRSNDEVNRFVKFLSGGEKARLSLAQIAANTPKLLILDEVNNNLDLETRNHVIEVLREYPGALLLISHDEDFLTAVQARPMVFA